MNEPEHVPVAAVDGEDKTLVLLYTSAGRTFTQSLVYSTDRGRTWTKYEKNPVIGRESTDNLKAACIGPGGTRRLIDRCR